MTEDGEQKTECRNFAILKIMIRDVTDLVVYKNSLRPTRDALVEKYKIISKQLNKLIQNWVTFKK